MEKRQQFSLIVYIGFIMMIFTINALQFSQSSKAAPSFAGVSSPIAPEQSAKNYWTPTRMKNARGMVTSQKISVTSIANSTRKFRLPKQTGKSTSVVPTKQKAVSQLFLPSSDLKDTNLYKNDENNKKVFLSSAIYQKQDQAVAVPLTSYNTVPISYVGTVFLHDPHTNSDNACTGTAITSANESVVDTAGHCVYNWRGQYWLTNILFCPQYHNGASPFGCWSARTAVTTYEYKTLGLTIHDFGQIVVYPSNDRTLGSIVGGTPFRYNQSLSAAPYVFAYGYPADSPFNGEQMYYVSGRTSYQSKDGGTELQLSNFDMNEGCSGGPWFVQASGSWFLNGHTSDITDQEGYSPYFNQEWKDLYDEAQHAPNS